MLFFNCNALGVGPGRVLGAFTALVLLACGPTSNSTEIASPSRQEVSFGALESKASEPPPNVQVVLLGTGTPIPQPGRSGPATAIIAWDRAYLVDVGRGALLQSRIGSLNGTLALDPTNIRIAFLTHLHSDHVIGLPDFIATPPTLGRKKPLLVLGPPGTRSMTSHFVAALKEDFEHRPALAEKVDKKLVSVREITPGTVYQDEYVSVTAFAVEHANWEHAYGFRFDTSERSIVISGDTAPTRAVVDACRGCDVLVHEVYCAVGMQETQKPQSLWDYNARAHTSARELGEIAAQAQPKLLVLTHRIDYGCSQEELVNLVAESFSGEIVAGADLEAY